MASLLLLLRCYYHQSNRQLRYANDSTASVCEDDDTWIDLRTYGSVEEVEEGVVILLLDFLLLSLLLLSLFHGLGSSSSSGGGGS